MKLTNNHDIDLPRFALSTKAFELISRNGRNPEPQLLQILNCGGGVLKPQIIGGESWLNALLN